MRQRIHWWWEEIVDRVVHVPFALREARRGAAERLRLRWWNLSAAVVDVVHGVRGPRRAD